MAEAKIVWFFAHLLGIPCLMLSALPKSWLKLIDINIGTIKEPYQSAIWILGVIYLISLIARSAEKWHHMHLRNREHRTEIRRKEALIKKGVYGQKNTQV